MVLSYALWKNLDERIQISMPKKGNKAEMYKSYIIAFATSLVTAYVLAHFVDYLEATSFTGAFLTAFWIWLGFFVTTQMGSVLWEKKSWTLYILNIAYSLVSLMVMAIIVALWV